MPEQKKESDTQILTRSSLLKKVLLCVVTGAIGLSFAGITWVCGSLLSLQNDMSSTKADVKWTKEKIEERFKEKPEDMALWERMQEHERKLNELEIKSAFHEGFWKGVQMDRERFHARKPKIVEEESEDDPDDEPIEEPKQPEEGKEEDLRSFRERHLRPWVQQQQVNEPLPMKK